MLIKRIAERHPSQHIYSSYFFSLKFEVNLPVAVSIGHGMCTNARLRNNVRRRMAAYMACQCIRACFKKNVQEEKKRNKKKPTYACISHTADQRRCALGWSLTSVVRVNLNRFSAVCLSVASFFVFLLICTNLNR